MSRANGKERNIQSLERAVAILDSLLDKPQGEKLTVIAQELGLSKSTTFGLVSTLENLGLLHQSSQSGKYMLGIKLLTYSDVLRSSLRLPDMANSLMEKLANRFGENVHLATLDDGSVLYLGTVTTSHAMQVVVHIGGRAPFYSTSLGKVLVAALPDDEIDALLERTELIPRTKNTICDKSVFRAELQKVRAQGYASERDEGEIGIACFAAPIRNRAGQVTAAISIAQPTARLEQRDPQEIIQALLETARDISNTCGDLSFY